MYCSLRCCIGRGVPVTRVSDLGSGLLALSTNHSIPDVTVIGSLPLSTSCNTGKLYVDVVVADAVYADVTPQQ
jgi:hypothetical protein